MFFETWKSVSIFWRVLHYSSVHYWNVLYVGGVTKDDPINTGSRSGEVIAPLQLGFGDVKVVMMPRSLRRTWLAAAADSFFGRMVPERNAI